MNYRLSVVGVVGVVVAALFGPVCRGQGDWQPSTDTSFDMRPLFYPVRDQMFRGSCATFAVVSALEYFPGVPRLSEAYVYAKVKAEALSVDGATLEGMKEFLDTNGLVAAEKMPYELVGVFAFDQNEPTEAAIGRAFNEKRGRQAAILADEAIYRAQGVRIYNRAEITWDVLETLLRGAKPFVCAFHMNGEQWASSTGGMIHSDLVPMADGTVKYYEDDGGHAVLCVGYRTVLDPLDPTGEGTLRQLLIRNSWGPQWGMQGYAWVTWETYAHKHLFQIMTIDSVATVVGRHDQAPALDLRVQGLKWTNDNYSAVLSTVVKSNYLPEGGIRSVEYTLFSGAGAMNPEFERFPLGNTVSTDAARGFLAVFDALSTTTYNVRMKVTYLQGGTTTLYFPVPEICQWSPEPDVTLEGAPADTGPFKALQFQLPRKKE